MNWRVVLKNTGVNAESLQFRRWRPQRCTETCQAGRVRWGRCECRARAQWELGDHAPRRRRRARKRAISVSLVEHAESHRAKYRSILPARQAGPTTPCLHSAVSVHTSCVRLFTPQTPPNSDPLGPTRLHLGAYELHQVQPMASQCCMSSGRGHGFCIFELCELRVLPRGRLVGQSRRTSAQPENFAPAAPLAF